jgi:hypothetical protein
MKMITTNNILISIKIPFTPYLPYFQLWKFYSYPLEILCKFRFHKLPQVYKPPKYEAEIKLNNVVQKSFV